MILSLCCLCSVRNNAYCQRKTPAIIYFLVNFMGATLFKEGLYNKCFPVEFRVIASQLPSVMALNLLHPAEIISS